MANRSSKTHKREGKVTSAPVASSSSSSVNASASVTPFQTAADNAASSSSLAISVNDRRTTDSVANQNKARSPIVTRSHKNEPSTVADRHNLSEQSAIASSSKSKKRQQESLIKQTLDSKIKGEPSTSSKTASKSRKKNSTHFEVTDLSAPSPSKVKKSPSPNLKRASAPELPSGSRVPTSKRFKKSHSSDNIQSNMERQQYGSNNDNNNPPSSGNNPSGSSSSNASTPPLANTSNNAGALISQIVSSYGQNLFEADEVSRLQTLLESRGFSSNIPSQFLGLPRVQHMFARSMQAGNSSRIQNIIAGLQPNANTSEKLSCVMDLCQILLMNNEDTLSGFPIKTVVPLLIQILQRDESPELIHHSTRATACFMEVLPRSYPLVAEAIPLFLQKLQSIDYMDVAEQTLSALAKLSKSYHKLILSQNGIATALQFLDFFPIDAQRWALAMVANCCIGMTNDDFIFLKDSLPILNSRLTMDDQQCIESTCIAFSRAVNCYQNDSNIISQIASTELLQNIQTVLVTTPLLLSSETFMCVVSMLTVMCSSCSQISVELLKSNVAETIKILLLSSDSNMKGPGSVHLVSRSSQEIYELSALLAELLPILPLTGFFEIDLMYLKGTQVHGEMPIWQWKDDRGVWQTFSAQENSIIEDAHLAGEDEFDVPLPRSFVIDLNAMQRINEDTGLTYPIQRKTSTHRGNHELANRLNFSTKTDPRVEWLFKEKETSECFLNFAFRVLNEVYNSSAGLMVRHKCLNGILRILYHTPKEMLLNILQDQRMSSSIATMLSSTDLRTVVCAIQMCNILMEKSPQTFSVYFQREGVLHEIRKLYSEKLNSEDKNESKSSTFSNSEDTVDSVSPLQVDNVVNRKSTLMEWSRSIHSDSVPGPSAAGKLRSRKKCYSSKSKKESVSGSSSKNNSDMLSDVSPVGTDSEIPTGSTHSSKSGKSKDLLSRFTNRLSRWNPSAVSAPNLPTTSINVASKEPVLPVKNISREKVRSWIIKNAKLFEETYFSKPADGGDFVPSDVLNQLIEAIKYFDKDNFKALDMIKQILLESDLSLFEMIHSGLVNCLLNFFNSGESLYSKEGNIRLFLNVFCNVPLTDLIQNPEDIHINKNAFHILVNKVNGCISQTEHLPIKVQEFSESSSSTGSQALHYLAKQSLKITFIRHSSCTSTSTYKGPTVKLEPLTSIYHVERFLLQRGLTCSEPDMDSIDDDFSEDEVDNQMFIHSSSTFSRHRLQIMIGDTPVPYDLTLFQAIKQYYSPLQDLDSENIIEKRFWNNIYPIHYRALSPTDSEALANNSNSLGRNRSKGAKGSKASKKKDELWLEGKTPKIESPFVKYFEKSSPFTFRDDCIDALNLMKIMFGISRHWPYLYQISNSVSSLISSDEFINQKLTTKANRQLQDVITILVGQIPNWISEIAYSCPFVFPFDTRHTLFHIASFDTDRALQRYIENNSADLNSLDSRQRANLPRLEKRKKTVSRAEIFKSAETQIFNDYFNPKNILEVSYDNEVGTGLGPTLEFYSMLSKEFQRNDFEMWRMDQSPPCDSKKTIDSEMNNYVFSHNGLFPSPIGRGTKIASINKLKARFRFLGKFIAKALMDSRLVDIPLNIVFYKWLLDEENSLNILDMHHVDSSFANSLLQMNRIAQRKLKMDLNHQDDLLKLHGCAIEDLNLEFTLPGYPNIELKKNGRDQAVMLSNLESYLNLVSHWMLYEGVSKQLDAFREGFNSIFPLSHLKIFYPEELQKLFCGTPNNKWDTAMLMKSTKAAHGYNHDSRAIKYLFEILSSYNVEEQRRFLQFITGCPRLPIGGFKALSPPLTIVRKDSEKGCAESLSLPSVMTCANYLKLPDYPTLEMMREKLAFAISEGQGSFHLS